MIDDIALALCYGAVFALILGALAFLADYLQSQEAALRNRYEEVPLGVESWVDESMISDPEATLPPARREAA